MVITAARNVFLRKVIRFWVTVSKYYLKYLKYSYNGFQTSNFTALSYLVNDKCYLNLFLFFFVKWCSFLYIVTTDTISDNIIFTLYKASFLNI